MAEVDGVTAALLLCLAEGGGSLVLTTLAPGTITTLPGRVIAGNRRRANKNIMLLNITIHPLGVRHYKHRTAIGTQKTFPNIELV